MGKRTIVLVIALGLAAVSAFAIWQYLTNVEEDVRADIIEVNVFRAARFIDTGTEGETLTQPNFIVESKALAEAVVFEGSQIVCTGVVEREGADPGLCDNNPSNLSTILDGTVAAGPISQGQLITQDMFVTPAQLNDISLSESIPAGKVAISIRPEEVGAVGGFIRPGDRVNMLASASVELSQLVELFKDESLRELIFGGGLGQTQGGPPSIPGTEVEQDPISAFADTIPASLQFTQTVLQDIEVLAVGADTRPSPLGTGLEPQGAQSIVLEVTPEQAEKIQFAREYTSVALTLLPKDQPYTEFEAQGVLVDDLFSLLERIEEQLRQLGASLGN